MTGGQYRSETFSVDNKEIDRCYDRLDKKVKRLHVRSVAHALRTASDDDTLVAGGDGLGSEDDGFEAASADLVHRRGVR